MASTSSQRLCWSVVLLVLFYSAGCIVFVALEREAELRTYAENRELYEQMKGLYSFHHCDDPAFKDLSFCQSQAAFSESLRSYFNQRGNSMEDLEQWTVLGTMFFLTHLGTTIGYGNSHPLTSWGQLATIFFGLMGIPIMGYILAQLARLDLQVSVLILEKVCCTRVNTVNQHMVVLWCLLCIFLFGGALIYSYLEPWTYLEALYFCFITLSTVGFGDYLPNSSASKAFSIFYMFFGLGVCASIIAVLTGLVAEGHEGVDTFVTKRIREDCGVLQHLHDACPEFCGPRSSQA